MGGRGSSAGPLVPAKDLPLESLYRDRGESGLRKTLGRYSDSELREIVKSNQVDRTGKYRKASRDKLINMITETTARREATRETLGRAASEAAKGYRSMR